jgi:hypothetical protein
MIDRKRFVEALEEMKERQREGSQFMVRMQYTVDLHNPGIRIQESRRQWTIRDQGGSMNSA